MKFNFVRLSAILILVCSMIFTLVSCGSKHENLNASDEITTPTSQAEDTTLADTSEVMVETATETTTEVETTTVIETTTAPEETTEAIEESSTYEEVVEVIITKVYGNDGNADAPIKASFIELYNVTDREVSLGDYSLYYGENGTFAKLVFSEYTVISPNSYFLIKCKESKNGVTYLCL